MKTRILSAITLLLLPYFVALEENAIYEYGPDNFRKQIEKMDGNFIMFYTLWCSHCKDFHPIWEELANLVNTKNSKIAIAQVDCTLHPKLCQENDITGYPTLLYFHKNSFSPTEYEGTRDLPSLTLYLDDVYSIHSGNKNVYKVADDEVRKFSGLSDLNDKNIEKYVSEGQHLVMFYAPWCKASQRLAPLFADLAAYYDKDSHINIGKLDCGRNEVCKTFDIKSYPQLVWIANGKVMGVSDSLTLPEMIKYVEKMRLSENHDPEKFMKKKKVLPVARISEETFDKFLENDLVYINYFAPWCAHCMQLSPLWTKLGERFQNESRVIIADVDCVRSKAICDVEKITSLPTLILYKHKITVSVDLGSQPLDSLIALVNKNLQEPSTKTSDEQTKEHSTEHEIAKDEL